MKRKKMIISLVILAVILISSACILMLFNTRKSDVKYEDKTSILDKISFFNEYFIDKYPIKSTDKISNQDKLYFASLILIDNNKASVDDFYLSDILKSYFGEKSTVKHKDIVNEETKNIVYKYDSKKGAYKLIKKENSLTTSKYFYMIYLSNQRKYGNKYVAEEKIIFVDYLSNPIKVYLTKEDYINKTNSFDTVNNMEEINDNYFKQNLEKLKTTTFTFLKEKGNFVLDSVI